MLDDVFLKQTGRSLRGQRIQTLGYSFQVWMRRPCLRKRMRETGVSVIRAGKWRWVDAHWGRGLSYLKIGWRWRWQGYRLTQITTFWFE